MSTMSFRSTIVHCLVALTAVPFSQAIDFELYNELEKRAACTSKPSWYYNSTFTWGDWKRTSDPVVFADLDGDGKDEIINLGPQGQIDDFPTSQTSIARRAKAPTQATRANVRLADIDGDGKADYLILNPSTGELQAYINNGPGSFTPWTNLKTIFNNVGAASGVTFADINGDGKADYLFVDASGNVTAYINEGYTGVPDGYFFGTSPNAPANLTWHWSSVGKIQDGRGSQAEIKFADIDGDKKADYLVVASSTGAVSEYQNGGKDSKSPNGWKWTSKGEIRSKIAGTTGSQVYLSKIVGSGRADYVIVPSSGQPKLYVNQCTA